MGSGGGGGRGLVVGGGCVGSGGGRGLEVDLWRPNVVHGELASLHLEAKGGTDAVDDRISAIGQSLLDPFEVNLGERVGRRSLEAAVEQRPAVLDAPIFDWREPAVRPRGRDVGGEFSHQVGIVGGDIVKPLLLRRRVVGVARGKRDLERDCVHNIQNNLAVVGSRKAHLEISLGA